MSGPFNSFLINSNLRYLLLIILSLTSHDSGNPHLFPERECDSSSCSAPTKIYWASLVPGNALGAIPSSLSLYLANVGYSSVGSFQIFPLSTFTLKSKGSKFSVLSLNEKSDKIMTGI